MTVANQTVEKIETAKRIDDAEVVLWKHESDSYISPLYAVTLNDAIVRDWSFSYCTVSASFDYHASPYRVIG